MSTTVMNSQSTRAKRTARIKWCSAAVALTLVMGGITACSWGGNNDTATDSTKIADYLKLDRDQIRDGGTLTTAIVEINEQQNAFHGNSTAYTKDVWKWYNPQLTVFAADGTWDYNKSYLTDVTEKTVDDKKTQITYTIEPKATFNDGTPIDWRTFEATWKANNGTNKAYSPNSTDGWSAIESVVQGANSKQVIVTYKRIYTWWQGIFDYILHPKAAEINHYEKGYLNKVHPEWGAGPYKVESVNFHQGFAVFVRNEKWWGPKGKLDKRIFRTMEPQASISAFKNGEIDATDVGSKDRLAQVRNLPNAKIHTGRRPQNGILELNAATEQLKDPAVREAVFTAIDRKILADISFQGLNYKEDAPGSLTLFSFQPGYRDNFSKALQFDVDRAKSLLTNAGWKENDGGTRIKDGKKLTLRYALIGDDSIAKATANALRELLGKVGVVLKIEQRPSRDFAKIMNERDFDLVLLGFVSTDPFGVAYFNQIYSSDSELNLSSTGTKELDKKIHEITLISDPEKQIAAANDLEVEAFQRFGLMPTTNGPHIVATKKGLANFGATAFATIPVENIGWQK